MIEGRAHHEVVRLIHFQGSWAKSSALKQLISSISMRSRMSSGRWCAKAVFGSPWCKSSVEFVASQSIWSNVSCGRTYPLRVSTSQTWGRACRAYPVFVLCWTAPFRIGDEAAAADLLC